MTGKRRNRRRNAAPMSHRTAIASAAVAAAIVAATGCDNGGRIFGVARNGPAPVVSDLVFTRADGTQIDFPPPTFVFCGPFQPSFDDTPTLHVRVGGDPPFERGWRLRIVLADASPGTVLTFPNPSVEPQGAELVVFDPRLDSGADEFSTVRFTSGGELAVEEIGCGSAGDVAFRIDATIGEVLGTFETVRVLGEFRSGITGPAPGVEDTGVGMRSR